MSEAITIEEWEEVMRILDEDKEPSEDALDDAVSLTELDDVSPLNRAGMDDLTPVDTIMHANGDYIYVTGGTL